MIGTHPKRREWMGACGFAFALALVGCTNQQMSASNPFMAPDRVPPPATRTIAPGTAAPYYPGGPMPSAQIAPPAPPVAQAPLQFGAPPAAIAMATPAAASNPVPVAAPASPTPLQFSGDRTVAIPSDNQDLRFALPAPPSVNPATPQPIQQPNQQLAAAPAPASQVVPAGFNQPVANPQAVPTPMPTADASSSGPWRSPQVPQSGSPVMQAQYVQPQPAQPTMLAAQPPQPPAAQQLPVELRPVPSTQAAPAIPLAPTTTAIAPTTAPAVAPPPRMRFPSMLEPSTWFTPQPAPTKQPPAGQQLVGYMVPGPDGQMHMVSVEQYQASLSGSAQQPASVANSDGFRPRGTTTK